eukprot:11616065-Alexandrium_andersonii.AAC.1
MSASTRARTQAHSHAEFAVPRHLSERTTGNWCGTTGASLPSINGPAAARSTAATSPAPAAAAESRPPTSPRACATP